MQGVEGGETGERISGLVFTVTFFCFRVVGFGYGVFRSYQNTLLWWGDDATGSVVAGADFPYERRALVLVIQGFFLAGWFLQLMWARELVVKLCAMVSQTPEKPKEKSL